MADFINTDWIFLIELQKSDPINSCDILFDKVSTIVDTYLPLKKVPEKDKKIQKKPWINSGIRKSINKRHKLYNKFVKCKDPVRKEEIHRTVE